MGWNFTLSVLIEKNREHYQKQILQFVKISRSKDEVWKNYKRIKK